MHTHACTHMQTCTHACMHTRVHAYFLGGARDSPRVWLPQKAQTSGDIRKTQGRRRDPTDAGSRVVRTGGAKPEAASHREPPQPPKPTSWGTGASVGTARGHTQRQVRPVSSELLPRDILDFHPGWCPKLCPHNRQHHAAVQVRAQDMKVQGHTHQDSHPPGSRGGTGVLVFMCFALFCFAGSKNDPGLENSGKTCQRTNN